MILIRWLLSWLAAVVVTSLLGSIIQTQFNLARLSALGAEVSPGERLEVTLLDLAGFAPMWAIVVALALLIALMVAAILSRLRPTWRTGWHVLAGFVGVAVALIAMDMLLPVTPIAAARTVVGLSAMALAGAVGGLVHVRVHMAGRRATRYR